MRHSTITCPCATLKHVKTRNLTLNLPADLIRQAKVCAAQRDTTINAFVRQLLEEALSEESRRRLAVRRVLDLAKRGPHSNVDPGSIRREQIYERR